MNICLNTYPWAFGIPGGGEQQLHFYRDALIRGSEKWPSLNIELFDQWQPKFDKMQLMHYFSCMPSSLDFLDVVKARRGIPLLISPNFWPEPEDWKASGVYDDVNSILWLADKIVVNSFIEEEALVRLCKIDSSRISVIHNAVQDCFFSPIDPALFRDKYNVDGPFILNIGNVEPRKNQFAFLKALKEFPTLQLITIGGVRENWYLNACKEEGGEQFRLIDPLPPGSELLRSAIAGCEFFAMPSLRETPSIASLEAGAAGAKILTTDLGSTTEYFQDYADYVNPYDIVSMSEGIGAALAKEKNDGLSLRIKELYRWDVVVEKLVDTYSGLIGTDLRVKK
ncbi:glycosyltransferase [Ewingella americana]|uniref:Glycosyltransferase n=1 Tax=Ewingella americana TaxID=41202 RepID=A0A502GR62_9GAMM|nr:glycosyltransferase [Ewingella americana]TPG64837.1 glycosyltransferase [Ewingella americana]